MWAFRLLFFSAAAFKINFQLDLHQFLFKITPRAVIAAISFFRTAFLSFFSFLLIFYQNLFLLLFFDLDPFKLLFKLLTLFFLSIQLLIIQNNLQIQKHKSKKVVHTLCYYAYYLSYLLQGVVSVAEILVTINIFHY